MKTFSSGSRYRLADFNEELCRLHFLTPEQIRRAWVIFATAALLVVPAAYALPSRKR
jgi:hypothetical protein